jgi:hypothetical protein
MIMKKNIKDALWNQFGATIDMFGDALNACPDELWNAPVWKNANLPAGFSDFWYVAYHTLFFLDLYLTGRVEEFNPPAPFDLNELDPSGLLPERQYTKIELQSYLEFCRKKCHKVITSLTDEKAQQIYFFSWSKPGISYLELLLDNLRHVQEHGAQLSLFLGQQAGVSAHWVAKARDDEPAV